MIEQTKTSTQDDLLYRHNTPQPPITWQSAQQHLRKGRHAPALAGYRNLVQQFPDVSQIWAEMSAAAAGELDFALADEAAQRAADLSVADASMLVSLGQQHFRQRSLAKAYDCFQRAVAVNPTAVLPRLSLAAWFERARRWDEAWECLQTCLDRHPRDSRVLFFKAFLLHRKGLDTDSEVVLRDLIKASPADPTVRYSVKHLLATVLDALGQHSEAMMWLSKAKKQMREMVNTPALEESYDKIDLARRDLLCDIRPDTLRRWRDEAEQSPCPHSLAFLGGPPRSGTTLLEQILGAHPDVLVFDESDAFTHELLNVLRPQPPARKLTLRALNALTTDRRSELIGRYFKSLLREMHDWPGDKLLLDKNPSVTLSLHIWLRLFPQLKLIITLRDPRDVIISSYFQNVNGATGNVNFLSLQRAVKYYTDSMDVWLRMRDLDGCEWIETRYEDMVTNLEAEGRRVTNFLGLPWHEAQHNYHDNARRKAIFAPTYNDVTKPVYNKSVERWKNYAEELSPFQEKLQPYLKAFGYS
jgi:tetratricopeptide (TPR) repeat protein